MFKLTLTALLLGSVLAACTSTLSRSREPSSDESDVHYVQTLCLASSLAPSSSRNTTPEYRACIENVNQAFAQAPVKDKIQIALSICENPTAGETIDDKMYPRWVCYRNAIGLMKDPVMSREVQRCAGEINRNDSMALRVQGNCYQRAFTATHAGQGQAVFSPIEKFESLPPCSRAKYMASGLKIPFSQVPSDFHRQARIEAKQIWERAQLMAADTRGLCKADSVSSMMTQPQNCKETWSGPYLEEPLATAYLDLRGESFSYFINCWKD